MMKELKVGKQIKNNNGKIYTVLAVNGDRALLVGGWDFVVISDLTYFEKTGSWGNGKYFPFFTDENSVEILDEAFYYFNTYCFGSYMGKKDEKED